MKVHSNCHYLCTCVNFTLTYWFQRLAIFVSVIRCYKLSVMVCFGFLFPKMLIAQIESMTIGHIFTYPYLQLDPFVITKNCLHLEVNPHCADKSRGEGVVCIAEQEGGLAHAAVANDQQLKHVIKVLVSRIFLRGLLLEP